MRDKLTSIYFSLFAIGAVVENTLQPYAVEHYKRGVNIFSEQTTYLINHIGDVSNGFLTPIIPSLFSLIVAYATDPQEKSRNVQKLKQLIPSLALTATCIWILDAETIRLLPYSYLSVPELSDVPAGLLGLLACALFYDKIDRDLARSKAIPSNNLLK